MTAMSYEDYVARGWHTAKTDAHYWEAKHYHASPHGLLRSVVTPFATSEQPDPQAPCNHPVSLTFRRPLHIFEPIHEGHIEYAQANGHDGIVAHLPDNEQAVTLDAGCAVPEHDHDWPY